VAKRGVKQNNANRVCLLNISTDQKVICVKKNAAAHILNVSSTNPFSHPFLLWGGSPQARSHWGGIQGQCHPKYLLCPPNFLVPRKICFKNLINTKIVPPLKMYFAPSNLATGLVLGEHRL